jgi:hypothetical protein
MPLNAEPRPALNPFAHEYRPLPPPVDQLGSLRLGGSGGGGGAAAGGGSRAAAAVDRALAYLNGAAGRNRAAADVAAPPQATAAAASGTAGAAAAGEDEELQFDELHFEEGWERAHSNASSTEQSPQVSVSPAPCCCLG